MSILFKPIDWNEEIPKEINNNVLKNDKVHLIDYAHIAIPKKPASKIPLYSFLNLNAFDLILNGINSSIINPNKIITNPTKIFPYTPIIEIYSLIYPIKAPANIKIKIDPKTNPTAA